MSEMLSPAVYLRCSENSTLNPWNGLACRPEMNPSTMNFARRSSRRDLADDLGLQVLLGGSGQVAIRNLGEGRRESGQERDAGGRSSIARSGPRAPDASGAVRHNCRPPRRSGRPRSRIRAAAVVLRHVRLLDLGDQLLIRLSVVCPSAWAWKLVLMRWRRTGTATLRMSSSETLNRPSIAAIALPPRIRFCPARGPAPQSIRSLMNCGVCGSAGRVARTSRVDVLDHVIRDRHARHELLEVHDRLAREHLLQVGRLPLGRRREDLPSSS